MSTTDSWTAVEPTALHISFSGISLHICSGKYVLQALQKIKSISSQGDPLKLLIMTAIYSQEIFPSDGQLLFIHLKLLLECWMWSRAFILLYKHPKDRRTCAMQSEIAGTCVLVSPGEERPIVSIFYTLQQRWSWGSKRITNRCVRRGSAWKIA